MTDIVVEVLGGVVVWVYSRNPDAKVTIIDWDHLDGGTPDDCIGVTKCESLENLSVEAAELIRSKQFQSDRAC